MKINPNKSGICFHCGADDGLHQYETAKCPKWGKEAKIGKRQEWEDTTFLNKEYEEYRIKSMSNYECLLAENKRLREALEHIIEYWNRNENDRAMNDALYHIIETAEQVLSQLEVKEQ